MAKNNRNIELKAYCEIQLQIKELQAKADKIAEAADSQYVALTDAEKKTAFTFADRGVVQCSAPSLRKNFKGFYPAEFMAIEDTYKKAKSEIEKKLVTEEKFGWTKSSRKFACKVTAV